MYAAKAAGKNRYQLAGELAEQRQQKRTRAA
jgi:hypothetical protein